MKRQTWINLVIFATALYLLPTTSFAHHMGQGYGSAPDVVDNYAHGVNAESENQGGNTVATSGEDVVGNGVPGGDDSNGPASAMGGYSTGTAGGGDNAGTGDSGAGGGGPGGSDGADSGSGSGSAGGSGNGNGAGNGRN